MKRPLNDSANLLHRPVEPKSGSYPVVGKPDVGFGGPMMGAMRSLM
jgi:hypothetical protein